MALGLFSKLQKFQILSYQDEARSLALGSFKAMFNPASVSSRHENRFSKLQGINTSGRSAKYGQTLPREFSFDLVLDGNGVTETGISRLFGSTTVAEQVTLFKKLCLNMDGSLHQPKFLKIQWGDGELKDFSCRLQSVDIEYSLFDKNGAPLHAVLKTSFIEDLPTPQRVREEGKESPDLTHSRIVRAGDTLPLLSKLIYGSTVHYLRLAQFNQLDDFRNLTPGQEILFPPLDSDEAEP
jgi:hypothetical protein